MINTINRHPNANELKRICSIAKKEYSQDDVYVLHAFLCDNTIDKDYECFTLESLKKLAVLFVGKSAKIYGSFARIFDCNVIREEGETNALGKPLYKLMAKVYVPISDDNAELALIRLDKEVPAEISIGCSIKYRVCNICESSQCCEHRKGHYYDGKLCVSKLVEPVDAYEFAFVTQP